MARLLSWLPPWVDLRTVAFTLVSILMGLCVWWALREVWRAIQRFRFTVRAWASLLGHMDRELKTIKGYCERLEFALNRENSRQRVSIVPPAPKPEFQVPPPLDLNPTLDATDWVEDEKKTELRPDACLTQRGP
jgi:hypothetical protein